MWGLRRDLNPPQAVSAENFGKRPQPPILTRLYYEGQPENLQLLQYIIVRLPTGQDAYSDGFNAHAF